MSSTYMSKVLNTCKFTVLINLQHLKKFRTKPEPYRGLNPDPNLDPNRNPNPNRNSNANPSPNANTN